MCRFNVCDSNNEWASEVINIMNSMEDSDFVSSMEHRGGKATVFLLYNRRQIDVLRHCCCRPGGSVVCVDKTFNLTNVHATLLAFKNTSVVNRKRGGNPTFIGPIMLHDHSDFITFLYFFSSISGLLHYDDCANMRLGADDEVAMREAMTKAFPDSGFLYCVRHVKENVKRHLDKHCKLNASQKSSLVSLIFSKERGLLSSSSIGDFDDKSKNLLDNLDPEVEDKTRRYIQNT